MLSCSNVGDRFFFAIKWLLNRSEKEAKMNISLAYFKKSRVNAVVPLMRKRYKLEWFRMVCIGFGLGCFTVYCLLATKDTLIWSNLAAFALGGIALLAAWVSHRKLKTVRSEIDACRQQAQSPNSPVCGRMLN